MNLSQPHDQFVKRLFDNKTETVEFLSKTLPEKIVSKMDLENLEIVKERFSGKSSGDTRNDLLYRIPLKSGSNVFVYLLFEHKSYHDSKIYTQILEYLAKIYQWQEVNETEVKVVIPFVFYHGEKNWDLGNRFLEIFQVQNIPKDLRKFVPDFNIQLFTLRPNGKPFETGNLTLYLFLSLIQIIRTKPGLFSRKFKRLLSLLAREENESKRVDLLGEMIRYLFSVREDAERYNKREFFREVEGEYMTLWEKLELQSIEKGEYKNKLETAREMKAEGMDISVIQKITKLSIEELKEIGVV